MPDFGLLDFGVLGLVWSNWAWGLNFRFTFVLFLFYIHTSNRVKKKEQT